MNSMIKTNSMHEMLFEKRNKDYGAYVIRNAYNDTVVKSLVMVASTLLLFIGAAYVYNNFFGERIMAEEKTVEIRDRVVAMDLKPIEQKQEQPVAKQHYSPKVDAPSTVVKDQADPEPDKNLSMTAPVSKGTEGDTTNADPIPGDIEGKGVVPAITVVKPKEAVMFAEEMPEYIGGNKAMVAFISEHIMYPELSKASGLEGTVFVNFVVDEDGKVIRCKVLKGISKDCDEEALRVVAKMPAWKPGKNGGQTVPVMFNLPIRFKLN